MKTGTERQRSSIMETQYKLSKILQNQPRDALLKDALLYTGVSTIGVRRLHAYAYFYWRTRDIGHAYVDTYAHLFSMIF